MEKSFMKRFQEYQKMTRVGFKLQQFYLYLPSIWCFYPLGHTADIFPRSAVKPGKTNDINIYTCKNCKTNIKKPVKVCYSHLIFIYFLFLSLYLSPDLQESDGGAIHRVSNYPDLLLEMPRYFCPLVI